MYICGCTDHNILLIKYIAADKAQSLAAIFRDEEGAIDGVSAHLHCFCLLTVDPIL
jgi:hypothetical protein